MALRLDRCPQPHRWLKRFDGDGSVGKDIIPLAPLLFVNYRIQQDGTHNVVCAEFSRSNGSYWLLAAAMTAHNMLTDHCFRIRDWEKEFDMAPGRMRDAELKFLMALDWKIWIRDEEFKDFVHKMDVLWEVLSIIEVFDGGTNRVTLGRRYRGQLFDT